MADIITVTQSTSTITATPTSATVGVTQQTPVIEITDTPAVVTVNGDVTPVITVANGRSGVLEGQPIYIQGAEPVGTPAEYLWIQTGLGEDGTSMTFWVEDGL